MARICIDVLERGTQAAAWSVQGDAKIQAVVCQHDLEMDPNHEKGDLWYSGIVSFGFDVAARWSFGATPVAHLSRYFVCCSAMICLLVF